MRIIVAKTAGFCMGVRRAVDLAVDVADEIPGPIRTLGPLIHNNQTLEMLKARGVLVLNESERPVPGSTVLVRAHGVPPETEAAFKALGTPLIDGTCPKVKTVHRVITGFREKGYTIVIAGDEGHAEVKGLLGYAGDSGCLVQTPGDVDRLPAPGPLICLVAQTTFHRKTFDEIGVRLGDRFPKSKLVLRKTICAATDRRQRETEKLAGTVDAMIVVGGRHSANTLRLAEIAARRGAVTQHVETEQEIDGELISKCETVGVTAGASTPQWMIKRVVEHLEGLERTRRRTFRKLLAQIFDALSFMNVLVAFAAAAMYVSSTTLQGIPYHPAGAALSFLYFMSMYLWNSLASMDATRHLGIARYRFYDAHRSYLYVLVAVGMAVLLAVSFVQNESVFRLMLISSVAGSLYHFPLLPGKFRRLFRYRALKDIPTSRDLFVALAWAVVITFMPYALGERFDVSPATGVFFAWIFFLAYLRSVVLDRRDIQGDRIMGRETLVTILGERRVGLVTKGFQYGAAGLLIVAGLWGLTTSGRSVAPTLSGFLFQLPVLIYARTIMEQTEGLARGNPARFKGLLDGMFYLSGFFAGLWMLAG